ncbi:UNVERIFIED_CONTAM: putative aarF domain-containing protein kinase, chloroplastic [Sesamum calycinum]|uniref:AarF domain-containing protein kinase, chloroplastic n=1 Tax=Sesamum calycinum TaxID=2727403 RepID=A0AAW2RQ72_9LAMI
MARVSVFRGAACGRLPLIHHSQLPVPICVSARKFRYGRNKFALFARYSQSQDLYHSSQDSIQNLPKLVEDIVQTSINTGPRGALRLAQGIQAVIGVGSEWLTDASKTANSSGGLATELQLGLLSPVYLRKLFERLGATYIKLGQFIASAPTLFPPEYVQEFQYCFDRAPSVPFQEIHQILREELGKPIDTVFEYVDPTPIASASIAQVHGARIRDTQEDVVIKVLKPGIEDILVADLNFVYIVARILEFLSPDLSRASLVLVACLHVKPFMQTYTQAICGYYVMVALGSLILDLDTEIIVAAAREPNTNATAVSANLLVDERQMNALFLDVVRVSESYGLRFPREFALLMKQLLYFDRYTRLLAPNLNMLRDQRITIVFKSEKQKCLAVRLV